MIGLTTARADIASPPKVLVVGDSLSAAYGIPQDAGWVTLLQQRLRKAGYPHQVVNASITGDTTGGGLARLPAALRQHAPQIVILELGGNDGLRGFSPANIQANLRQMVELSQASRARVLLLGVRLPANYGVGYGERFAQVYAQVSDQTGASLVPFFLAGVAETRDGMLADGIHPAASSQPALLGNVWPALVRLLDATSTEQVSEKQWAR